MARITVGVSLAVWKRSGRMTMMMPDAGVPDVATRLDVTL
jgi:hypothetical protein